MKQISFQNNGTPHKSTFSWTRLIDQMIISCFAECVKTMIYVSIFRRIKIEVITSDQLRLIHLSPEGPDTDGLTQLVSGITDPRSAV